MSRKVSPQDLCSPGEKLAIVPADRIHVLPVCPRTKGEILLNSLGEDNAIKIEDERLELIQSLFAQPPPPWFDRSSNPRFVSVEGRWHSASNLLA